tara:strand:+ start:9525 stop:10187 length:663 start_codon:yes stop_codon:yes gene_type:complete
MKDLRFTYILDVISSDSMTEVADSSPRRLKATGANFDRVMEVRVNSLVSPSVSVLSPYSLEFEVPTAVSALPLADLSVDLLAVGHMGLNPQLLILDLSAQIQEVTGIQKLSQTVTKLLMTSVGTDRYAPQSGGNLFKIAGQGLSPEGVQKIQAAIQEAITRTESQIIEAQTGIPALTSEERLRSLQPGLVSVDQKAGRVLVEVFINSMAGTTQSVPVTLG